MYAVLFGKGNFFFPIGNEFFFPLPLDDFAEIVWPRADDPVRVLGGFAVARTAGEAVYHLNAQLFSKQNCAGQIVVKLLGKRLVRMQRISVWRKDR